MEGLAQQINHERKNKTGAWLYLERSGDTVTRSLQGSSEKLKSKETITKEYRVREAGANRDGAHVEV